MKLLTKEDEAWTIIVAILVILGICFIFTVIQEYFPLDPEDWSVPGFY